MAAAGRGQHDPLRRRRADHVHGARQLAQRRRGDAAAPRGVGPRAVRTPPRVDEQNQDRAGLERVVVFKILKKVVALNARLFAFLTPFRDPIASSRPPDLIRSRRFTGELGSPISTREVIHTVASPSVPY